MVGLTWTRWDVTLALISRRGMVIDVSFFEHLVAHQCSDEWSFYEITGCPTGYTALGGIVTSAPTVQIIANKVIVFARGTDGAIYYQSSSGSNFSGARGSCRDGFSAFPRACFGYGGPICGRFAAGRWQFESKWLSLPRV